MSERADDRIVTQSAQNSLEIPDPHPFAKQAIVEAATELTQFTIPFPRYKDKGPCLMSIDEAVFLEAVGEWVENKGFRFITCELSVYKPRYPEIVNRQGILGSLGRLARFGLLTRVDRGTYLPTPEGWKVYEAIKQGIE